MYAVRENLQHDSLNIRQVRNPWRKVLLRPQRRSFSKRRDSRAREGKGGWNRGRGRKGQEIVIRSATACLVSINQMEKASQLAWHSITKYCSFARSRGCVISDRRGCSRVQRAPHSLVNCFLFLRGLLSLSTLSLLPLFPSAASPLLRVRSSLAIR